LASRYHREQKADEVEKGSRVDPNSWQGKGYRARYWNEAFFDALDILRPVAKKYGLTEAECAFRWMTHHSMLKREYGDAVIIGASSTKHLEENLVDLEKGPLPEEVVQALDAGWEKTRAVSGRYWH
jgi:aflatoxin B1 aldehyde reductase